jgi:hypothetical protein
MASPPRPPPPPPPKRAEPPGRGRRRLKLIGRLVALVGGPLFVIFMIFATGVYFGAANTNPVIDFEARWLGMEPRPDAGDETGDVTGGEVGDENGEAPPTKPEPTKVEPTKVEPTKTEPTKVEPTKPEPTKVEPTKVEPTETRTTLPIAVAEPLTGELAELLDDTRVIRVKIMVDPALLVTQQDWLAYVDELLRSSSTSFEGLFGVSLRLHGIVLWEPAGSTSEALLADLAGRDREGADRIVGLAARPMPGDPPAARDDGVVLVFADLDARDHFHRPLLRALAASFGAVPIRDRTSAAWQGGSFMSDAPVSAETPPWIDPDNRARVLRSKFGPSSATEPAESEPKPESD